MARGTTWQREHALLDVFFTLNLRGGHGHKGEEDESACQLHDVIQLSDRSEDR